jgi:hypothetical protein
MEGALVLIALAAGACALVFVASFFTALYTILLAGARSGALVSLPEERDLSWGERAGRRNSRGNRVFVADEFRPLRRLLFGAVMAMIGSFALLWLLLAAIAPRIS